MVKSSADALLEHPQRHPRLLEDRDAQARARADSVLDPRSPRRAAQAAGAARRAERTSSSSATCCPTCRASPSAIRDACGRCSSTWSATRSSSPSAARSSCRSRSSRRPPTRTVLHYFVSDSGIGIPERQAASDLRAVQAGRRIDDAPLRRHRPRPGDLVDARRADGRPDLARERAARRQHVPLHRARSASPTRGRSRRPSTSPICRC